MRYLSLSEVLDLYLRVMSQSGGAVGVRDLGSLESALALPRQSFAGEELYGLRRRIHSPTGIQGSDLPQTLLQYSQCPVHLFPRNRKRRCQRQ